MLAPDWAQKMLCIIAPNLTADSHENVAGKVNTHFSVSIVIIPTHLLCQMQANSSGAEFLSTISKFIKRNKNFVIARLRPPQNVKLGIITW